MKTVELSAQVQGIGIESAFDALSDFSAYAGKCPAVRSVVVENVENSLATRSTWEVNFQNGILKWSEHDVFDRERHEIRFKQISGDMDHFSGSWRVTGDQFNSEIVFRSQFDLGIPMLADMLDPIAETTIRENIYSIISGLFSTSNVRMLNEHGDNAAEALS
jgi:ribosome-associated toxin RatA of RatAB toxin-antitoxin module